MKVKIDRSNFDRRTVFSKLLEFISTLNPNSEHRLHDSEIALLVEFLMLPEKYKYYRFSAPAKTRLEKTALKELGWKLTRTNLNNKIYSILDKGYLVRDEDGVIYFAKYLRSIVEQILDDKTWELTLQFNNGIYKNTEENQ